jgi:glycosyltransferase involved in cell wall biosynthesis
LNSNLRPASTVAIIAYACDPGAGSEPGAGGRIALEAARLAKKSRTSCVIITRQKHVAVLETALRDEGLTECASIRAVSVGPRLDMLLKDGSREHSLAWQWSTYRALRSLQRSPGGLVVHHVTFASDTLPSAIHLPGLTSAKKIWGPVGSSDSRFEYPTTLLSRVAAGTKRRWFRFLCSRVDLVVAQTGHVANRLQGLAVEVVIEQNCIVRDGLASIGRRSEADHQVAKPRVALVGVLTDRKRPQLAIDALRATGEDSWELVVMGDGPLRRELEASNRDLLNSGALRFTGWLSHDEAQDEVARCAGLIHPSVREGAPWAIAEALSQGKWVVTVAGNGADYLVGLVEGGGAVVRNDGADLGQALGGAVTQMLASDDCPAGTDRWNASRFGYLLSGWYARD